MVVKLGLEKACERMDGNSSIMLWQGKVLVLLGGNGFSDVSPQPTSLLLLMDPLMVFSRLLGALGKETPFPFPFHIGSGSLSQIIIKAETKRLIKGLLVGNNKTNVSHLQFAYDTLFLFEGDPKNVRILKLLIQCFESVTGLNINWQKSHILGISLSNTEYLQMASSLGSSLKDWPLDYLGVSLGGLPRYRDF